MSKLLFIGHGYHVKTRSCQFVLDLLEDHFDVSICRVDQYRDDPFSILQDASGEYDVLVCWQITPPRELLDRYFKWNHAALFPMYDSASETGNPEQWFPYRDFNIICFSRKLFDRISRMGFSAQYIQYFPEPPPLEGWGDPRSVFFWARQEEINCPLVERLLQHTDIKKIHVHRAMDPEEEFAEPDQDGKIEYTFSTWFDDQQEMQQLINESVFYIAPRSKEGIGLSFLEAMADGRCVIAPDESTMNEYIEHGKTGYLYDLKHPAPVYITDIRNVQKRARLAAEKGYAHWLKDRDAIVDWVQSPAALCRWRLAVSIARRTFTRPLSVAKLLWRSIF